MFVHESAKFFHVCPERFESFQRYWFYMPINKKSALIVDREGYSVVNIPISIPSAKEIVAAHNAEITKLLEDDAREFDQ